MDFCQPDATEASARCVTIAVAVSSTGLLGGATGGRAPFPNGMRQFDGVLAGLLDIRNRLS